VEVAKGDVLRRGIHGAKKSRGQAITRKWEGGNTG